MRLVKVQERASPPPAGPVHPDHRPHRLPPWAVGLLAALLVAGIGTVVEYRLHARPTAPPLVFLAPVTRGPVAAHLELEGILEPADTRTIMQPIAGRASQVLVGPGDEVAPGQVVARFDPIAQRAELARAESRVVAAEADAFMAELAAVRLAQRLPLDETEAEEAVAVVQVRVAATAAELEARLAAYRVAQRQLSDRMIRSPMAGVVLKRHVEPGQIIDAGAPLLVIGAPSRLLRLVAEAPERALAQVTPGQTATFTVPAFPGRVFTARVARLGQLAGPQGARHLPVVLDVNNEGGPLAIGMTAAVNIATGTSGPVYRVPLSALAFWPTTVRAEEAQAVWVGDAGSTALVHTPVQVGATDGVHVEVRAPGLREGQMVAVGFARVGGQ